MEGQMATTVSGEEESRFEVRAENLSVGELEAWTVLSDAERQVVKKLTGPGAKLVSGPRGSGKSTLLRFAYFELLKTKAALPVYVNFSKALALEPLFHTHADALKWFRLWVLSKIVDGVGTTFGDWQHPLPVAAESVLRQCRSYIGQLETGTPPQSNALHLSPSGLVELLSELARFVGAARTVLLLDDAAHAFSVKQQREFFEVFRELRSREISAKAAIYPGVTSFSPSFQVGHEAEVIEVWFRPDTDTYLDGLEQIASRRFSDLEARLGDNYLDVVHALGLAAFGLPRGFVNMIGEVTDQMDLGVPIRKAALAAIATQAESVHAVFQNIADKLPRFANYVSLGKRFFTKGCAAVREFNRTKSSQRKSATIGLAEPIADELERTLRFMEYAGLIRRIEDLSKGVKGNYRRYSIHYACLVDANGLALGKAYKLSDVVSSLRRPPAHSLVKTKPESLLGPNYTSNCTLALPPCPKCGTPRLNEDQKFCMNCGNELRSASLFVELLQAPIELLPIPDRKKEALRASNIATVQQILSDESQRFRRPGSSIGPIWARRIVTVAEEYISV
jgi:hypothetical protein